MEVLFVIIQRFPDFLLLFLFITLIAAGMQGIRYFKIAGHVQIVWNTQSREQVMRLVLTVILYVSVNPKGSLICDVAVG